MEQQGKYVNADPYYIDVVMGFGYSREQAINILNGKAPNGETLEQLPF